MTATAPETETKPMPAARPVAPSTAKVQERMMGILTLAFFGGILLYTFMPEGTLRFMAIAAFSLGIIWLLRRFGI
jgi:predicted lipid-binding transport protein (Tim44 family)